MYCYVLHAVTKYFIPEKLPSNAPPPFAFGSASAARPPARFPEEIIPSKV